MASHAIYRQTRVKTSPRFSHPHAWQSPSAFPFHVRFSGLASYVSRRIHGFTAKTLPTLTDGLVAYYPFNGNANDLSSTGNNGTTNGGVVFSPGAIGQSAQLDGVDDYIRIPNHANNTFGSNDFTISLWVNPKPLGGGNPMSNDSWIDLFSKYDLWSRHVTIAFYPKNFNDGLGWRATGTIAINVRGPDPGGSTAETFAVTPVRLDDGAWHHLAAQNVGGSIRLFADGVQVATTSVPAGTTFQHNHDVILGNSSYFVDFGNPSAPGNDGFFFGNLDELKIYNRVLSSAEILTLYQEASDVTAPVLSAVTASSITTSTAVITWTTDENSTSVVEYGPTTAYGQVASVAGSVTNHSVPLSSLASGTTYHFRVRSEDSVGNQGTSTDSTLATVKVLNWTQSVASTGVGPRSNAAVVSFGGNMMLFGADPGSGQKNDIWSSPDGITWTQVAANSTWSARDSHSVTEFNGKLWLIAGRLANITGKNDVYSSVDGITWTQETAAANFPRRMQHRCVVFNGKLWIVGGCNSDDNVNFTDYNDVWSSTDGGFWTQATANAAFPGRGYHGLLVFNNKMWVIGGYRFNGAQPIGDVWSSSDGVNWTQATANAQFSPRSAFACQVFDGKMWVISGDLGGTYPADAWYSTDGVNWTQAVTNNFVGRYGPGSLLQNGKIWVMFGHAGSDVWYTP